MVIFENNLHERSYCLHTQLAAMRIVPMDRSFSTKCIAIVRTLADTITKTIICSKSISSLETRMKISTTTVVPKEGKMLTEVFESCRERSLSSFVLQLHVRRAYEEVCDVYS